MAAEESCGRDSETTKKLTLRKKTSMQVSAIQTDFMIAYLMVEIKLSSVKTQLQLVIVWVEPEALKLIDREIPFIWTTEIDQFYRTLLLGAKESSVQHYPSHFSQALPLTIVTKSCVMA